VKFGNCLSESMWIHFDSDFGIIFHFPERQWRSLSDAACTHFCNRELLTFCLLLSSFNSMGWNDDTENSQYFFVIWDLVGRGVVGGGRLGPTVPQFCTPTATSHMLTADTRQSLAVVAAGKAINYVFLCPRLCVRCWSFFVLWTAHSNYCYRWPFGLKRTSAAARLLVLRVRIPPGAWSVVCC